MSEQKSPYDLIVVGAGVAGLSAAYYWISDIDPDARVLLIDQASALGGHAARHSFEVDGKHMVSPGGSRELVMPSAFAPQVAAALLDLGIDTSRFYEDVAIGHYTERGAGHHALAFARDTWGRSHLVPLTGGFDFSNAPLAAPAKEQIAQLFTGPTDWLAGLGRGAKLAALRSRSCDEVLRDFAELHEDVHKFLSFSTAAQSGMTFDQHPALDAALVGYLGMDGLGLVPSGQPWEGLTATGTRFFPHSDPPIFRFPDGNATVVRALAHRLIPELFPVDSVDARVTADMASDELDRSHHQVRIRLGCGAVQATHAGRDRVSVELRAADGAHSTVQARAVIVATCAEDAARLVPELSADQRATAESLGRYPMVSATLALRNWRSWHSLGVSTLYWPAHPTWQTASLEFPVRVGGHAPVGSPEEPITVSALGSVTRPGRPPAAGAAAGRELLSSRAGQAEVATALTDLISEALEPAGFDADRDIAESLVEYWPQGYARYTTSLDGADQSNEVRKAMQRLAEGVGLIAVAGVDVTGHPFLDGAMESAHLATTRLGSSILAP